MENNNLIETWQQKKHVPENQKLDSKMIRDYLKPKVSKVIWAFNLNLVFYLTALLASVVLLSMNLYGYRANPVMLAVESGLLLLSVIFLGYGIFIFMKIREINNFSKDLHELLVSKTKFLRFHYEIWLIITAFVVWILSFALNTLVDNQDGFYRINKVGVFLIISITMLIFIYAVQKFSSEVSLRNLRAILSDLEAGYLDQTEIIAQKRKKLRWFYFAGIIVLTALLILAVLFALNLV